jgi:NAD(P)-dependent dehydrogenase (short-subunit alcohol dehydrogenase family)
MRQRTIVITGCSTGFGRATALALTQRGWHVFATVRKPADAESLLVQAKQCSPQTTPTAPTTPGILTPVLCDITQPEQVAALAQFVADATPRLDALLNNAGTAFVAPVELLALDDLRAQLEVNFVAHVGVIQALLPLLKVARGTIINVSSVGGRISIPAIGAYAASKFALEAMSDALRLELAPAGVRVVLIQPGASKTNIWDTSLQRAESSLATYRGGAYERLLVGTQRLETQIASVGFPPELFAETVQRILASKHPRARYPIPASATLQIALHNLTPTWLWDMALRLMLRW